MSHLIESYLKHADKIWIAFWETNFMMGIAMLVTLILGLVFGLLLFSFKSDFLNKNGLLYQVLSISLNALRSVPFIIFIFILIPLSRKIFGTSFGNLPATLPLSLVGISLFSRFVEQALLAVPPAIIDRGRSMGASKLQLIIYFLLPSIVSDAILSFTSVVISILSYSTVMGVIGAGGLGEYAFRYGYQEYDYPLMYVILILFVVYVFLLQSLGYLLARTFKG